MNQVKLFRLQLVMALLVLVSCGCTTFRSTIMERDEHDRIYPQSRPRTSAGVPVKLKVPTHLEVTIKEKYQIIDGVVKDGHVVPPEIVNLGSNGRRFLNVETAIGYTDKVFTVDFPRPFSGDLTLGSASSGGLQFDGEQFFSQVHGTIDDQTIEDINSVIKSELPTLQNTLAKAAPKSVEAELDAATVGSNIKLGERVVAFQRFDISECDWEAKVQNFINFHLNCNQACPDRSFDEACAVGCQGPAKQVTEVMQANAPQGVIEPMIPEGLKEKAISK